ncbi:hypothetical protein DL98DRAFT_522456 [Cadophora sp. DSE1049]|nr:hypothetical protein DL98DRAFT_522456 [Cadophora sp. DSE1049]
MGSFQSVTVVPHASQKSNQHDPPPQKQRAGQRPHLLRPVEPHLQSSQFSQPSSHTTNKTQQRPGYTGPLVWHFSGSSKGAMMQDPEGRYRDLGEFCRSAPDSETKVLNPVIFCIRARNWRSLLVSSLEHSSLSWKVGPLRNEVLATASRPIDDQLKKLLHQQIVVVSTLDKPQNYWLKRFSEFFDSDKEVIMIDMDKVRGSMSDYQLAVGERVRERQVILFKSLSRSRDQRDIFELSGEHRRMWMMTDNVKAELEWLPHEAVYFKPTKQESLEGDGEMKKGTDDDDYELVDTPDAKLPDTEL